MIVLIVLAAALAHLVHAASGITFETFTPALASAASDEEKFTITMTPCGSGGKLVLEGGYKPPRNLARVKKAQPQTFGKENFPVYCTHCAFQEIVPIEVLGHPIFITDPPDADKIGEIPCSVYIYKDPKNIPEEFYERIGKKKPG